MNAPKRQARPAPYVLLALCAFGITSGAAAQSGNIAINATGAAAQPTAMLDVSSLTKGMLIPRIASLPAAGALPNGLTAYRTGGAAALHGFYVVDNGQWVFMRPSKDGWDLYGNKLLDNTDPNPDFIGTTDDAPMYFRTNGIHRMRLDPITGFLGVGYAVNATVAKERLDINGGLSMYYAPAFVTNEISNTETPGVIRYQTYGTPTGATNYKYGSNEKTATYPNNATVNNAVLGNIHTYPLQYAGHWGNVDGTSMVQGSNTPSVVQPNINGWRLFENPYTEETGAYTHPRDAKCVTNSTADIPSGVAYISSSNAAVPTSPVNEQELVTPFLGMSGGIYIRRQYLFLASEVNLELAEAGGINASEGLCPGGEVDNISLYVVVSNSGRIIQPGGTNFTITVRNAPGGLSALNGFDNTVGNDGSRGCGNLAASSPWPTAGAGWKTIPLTTPFVWDGTSNVIVEIALKVQPGIAVTNSPVRCTDAGFNATYGANTTIPSTSYLLPDPGSPGWSCDNSANIQTRMADNNISASYHAGASHYRPVIQFGGEVTERDLTSLTSGNGSYIHYPGALVLEDTVTTVTDIPWGRWRPNFPSNSAYWAFQGKGTLSAQHGVYDNSSRLNDHVFDRAFDGRVAPEDAAHFGDQGLLSISEMEQFTEQHRHLPTMKGRKAWHADDGFSLGDITNQLWTTTETQALYVTDLHDKLNVIEMLTNERPITADEFRTARHELGALVEYTDADKARLIADLRKRATLTSPSR